MVRADLLQLVLDKSPSRAAVYRERATQLRVMAETEAVERVRDKFLDLAEQYEELAARAGS